PTRRAAGVLRRQDGRPMTTYRHEVWLWLAVILLCGACDDSSTAEDDDTMDVSVDQVADGDVPEDMGPDTDAPSDMLDTQDVTDGTDLMDTSEASDLDVMDTDMTSGMCEVVDPSGYGECATPLGFAF